MPVKIRLARHGRKRKPFYHIVIADSRAPRDGRLIERIGSYNPNTNPATIELDFDLALGWIQKGAQPTDTVKGILSHHGVLHMNHLLKGVAKGAFTEEVAMERFKDWMEDKEARIQAAKDTLTKESDKDQKARFNAEIKVKEARAAAIAAKQSELAAEAARANAPKEEIEEVAEEVTEEVTEEVADEVADEVTETVTEEVTNEVADEVTDEKQEEMPKENVE